jgi:predicted nucleotidyltransferase
MELQRLEAIAAKYGARLILQFGSSVSGKTHVGSDVDLAVLLDEPELSTQRYAELVHELQTLEEGAEVDLVVLNRADPLLLRRVSDGCVRLYGSDREFQRFRLLAFKRYQDYRPYLELERGYVTRALERDFPPS